MGKRVALALLCLGMFMLLVAGCGGKAPEKEQTLEEKVDAILATMTPAEKVGQMVTIGVRGETADEDSLYMLHQYHIGGVVLFDRNMKTAEQTKNLIDGLQKNAGEKVPLFIGVDEEGGDVVRGAAFLEPPPSQQSLGNEGETTRIGGSASRTAKALKKLGFNVNFAPVADVGESSRDFSSDPESVQKFVLAAAQGYEENRMLYALKHFPGIGRGTVDSHEEVSTIDATAEDMAARDLLPFQAVIDEKQPEDYFILVSHLKYTAYDKENPASLSKVIQTDLLREKLGYRGIIITDDVEMGALAKHYDFRTIGKRAVEAGADIVLVCHEYPHETDVYLGILDAVESGEIPMDRIDASVRRILTAKLLHLSGEATAS